MIKKYEMIILILLNLLMVVLIVLAWFLPVTFKKTNELLASTDQETAQEVAFSRADQEMERDNLELVKQLENRKILESISLKQKEIEEKEQNLLEREKDLSNNIATLEEERKNLLAQKEQLKKDQEEKKSYEQRLVSLARQFTSMPPEQAVERLLAIGDDLFIIDILNKIDSIATEGGQNSIVPYFISLMPKEAASRIVRKSVISF